ncbi:odorant receptor 294 [Tribolium castaneum]|uniref:Odorant receptor n=1 Tax=Tribolium castaneum TaxID=7070 RepID=D6WEU8_TRICA|nr:odorant receptor 294 [Tribolium castaneum]
MIVYEEKIDQDVNGNDILWVMRKVCIDCFQYKIVKILLLLLAIFIAILTLVQGFRFLERFDGPYFIKYAPAFIRTFVILVAIAFISFGMETAIYVKDTTFWLIDSAGLESEKRIKKHAMYTNIFFVSYIVVGVISAIFHIIPLDDDNDVLYPLALFEEYVPDWKNLFSSIYRFTFLTVPFTLGIPLYTAIYIITTVYYQILLFVVYVKNINTDLDVENVKYQETIEKRLIFCIQRHSSFLKRMKESNRKMSATVLVFSIVGILLGASVLMFLFSFHMSFKIWYYRIITMVLPTGAIFIHIIFIGQSLENAISQLEANLKMVEWYHWNIPNRKLYLIFLINTQEQKGVKFSQNVSVNYKLGVSIAKAVYSLISLMSNLRSID